MASLYPSTPPRSAAQVTYTSVNALASSLVDVKSRYGTTLETVSTQAGNYPAGSSILVIRANGDPQRGVALGVSGYAAP